MLALFSAALVAEVVPLVLSLEDRNTCLHASHPRQLHLRHMPRRLVRRLVVPLELRSALLWHEALHSIVVHRFMVAGAASPPWHKSNNAANRLAYM